jgi:cytosine/uracil/thiamine/allantoin permease
MDGEKPRGIVGIRMINKVCRNMRKLYNYAPFFSYILAVLNHKVHPQLVPNPKPPTSLLMSPL